LEEAKEYLKSAEGRRASITDKCKTLLTLSSVLLTFVSVLLSKVPFGSMWIKFLFLLAVFLLVIAVILFAVFIGVRAGMRIEVDQKDVELDKDELKKRLINNFYRAYTARKGIGGMPGLKVTRARKEPKDRRGTKDQRETKVTRESRGRKGIPDRKETRGLKDRKLHSYAGAGL
jgi:hypothetical protein